MTAPATVRALGQRLGRDDPALPRSRWTQGWSVCPGPSAQTLDCPRPWEHTRVGVRGLPVEAPPATYDRRGRATSSCPRPRVSALAAGSGRRFALHAVPPHRNRNNHRRQTNQRKQHRALHQGSFHYCQTAPGQAHAQPSTSNIGRSTPMSVTFTTIHPPSVHQRRPNSVIPASAALSCVVAASQTRPLPLVKHPRSR